MTCIIRLYIILGIMLLFVPSLQLAGQEKKDMGNPVGLLKKSLNDSEATVVYNKIISYYSKLQNDSAIIYAREGLELFKQRKYIRGQAWMVFALGDYDDTHGNTESASEKLNYALKLFTSQHDIDGMANTSNVLGVVEAKKAHFDKSLSYFHDCEQLFTSVKDKDGLMRTWLNLGLVYDYNGDTIKNFIYYKKVDSISKYLPVSDIIIRLYNNLGANYYEKHDTVTAFYYLRKAASMSEKPEFVFTHIITLNNLAQMQYGTGNKAEGRAMLNEALARARQYNLPDQEANILMNFALLGITDNSDSAIYNLTKALTLVKKTGNKINELAIYKAFQQLYEGLNDYKKSNDYFKLIFKLNDSLYNVDKAKEIANITSVYDLQQSNNKVKELEELAKNNANQRDVIVFIALVTIAILLVLFSYYKKVKRLNISLEKGRRELEELNAMKDKVFMIIGHDLRGPIANIPAIIDIIEDEVVIPELHRDLLDSLKEQATTTIETLDKLLLMGKSAMEGTAFTPVAFYSKKYITKNIELMHYTADKKEITISDNTPPNITLEADTNHFDFIIRNLLSNAIKFSYQGGNIEINSIIDRDKNLVTFGVRDYGAGIPENVLKTIFKSTVVSTYGTMNEKGNGIALMLCKEFVEKNGGHMLVESIEGSGACFYFSMRLAKNVPL